MSSVCPFCHSELDANTRECGQCKAYYAPKNPEGGSMKVFGIILFMVGLLTMLGSPVGSVFVMLGALAVFLGLRGEKSVWHMRLR